MMIAKYFDGIRQKLILDEKVVSFKVLKELLGNHDGFIRVKCLLEGSNILEFAEYAQVGVNGRIILETYSYHWQTKTGRLIKRWDNAPHHREMATFPDHLHDGEVLKESKPMTLINVLKEVAGRIPRQ